MNSLLKAKEAAMQAVQTDKEKKFEEAIDNYTSAVRHFRSALISDEKEVVHFKVEAEIKLYLKRMGKLEMLLKNQSDEQCVGSEQGDILNSDENETVSSKAKNEDEIKFYLRLINKLEMEVLLLKQNKEQSFNSEQNNIKVKFADLCGLGSLKNDLIHAALLPLKQPQLFSNTKPYKGFLLFGVSILL